MVSVPPRGTRFGKLPIYVDANSEMRTHPAITMLREQLGAEADTFVPVVNGGINLSKLCGVMHNTCHAANAIARTVRVLRDESGRALYGAEEWGRMIGDHEREWLDFLCGNHSRNLHFDAYLRLFASYINLIPLPLLCHLFQHLPFCAGKIRAGLGSGACEVRGAGSR